ncbi:MAG: tetratricopeptide repeat protein [Planctomycetota bacterium]|nr:tetratricopeptide repeat protein [Planctomycetota bacterium]
MTLVIVYSFAVDPSLAPVVDAPAFGVLARQIPRLVVGSLNGDGDRNLRFFPWLGTQDGRREFFMIPDMLPVERLVKIHGQKEEVRFVIDGRIGADGVRVRIVEVASLSPVFEETLLLDPLNPYSVVTRIVYELSGLLGRSGPLPKAPEFAAPDLSYFVVAKDDLLCLEIGLERDGRWLQAITKVAQNHLDKVEVRELAFELCRRLSAIQACRPEVTEFLTSLVARSDDTEVLSGAAALLQVLEQPDAAAEVLQRLVGRELAEESTVLRVVGHLFHRGSHRDGLRQLEIALDLGPRSPRLLVQLMVMHQRLGNTGQHRAIVTELAQRNDLPVVIGRMVCGELIDFGQVEDAIAVVCRCLTKEPEDAGLWLELGRAFMHHGNPSKALEAFDKALSHDPSDGIREEVQRQRRFVNRPGVLAELGALEEALASGDLVQALDLAQRLTREHEDLAEAWLFLGIVRQRMDEVELAIAGFRQALVFDPKLGEAHNRLGILLVGLSEHQKAYDHLQLAVTMMPSESGPWIHLAQACFYLDKADEGRAALDQAGLRGAKPEVVESVRRAFFAENS